MISHPMRRPVAPPARRVRRVVPRALAALLAAGAAVSACGGTPDLPAPSALIRSATAAAGHAGSMHFLEVTTVAQSVATLSGDLSGADEQETLVQKTGILQVRLVSGVVYVNAGGLASVLESLFGLNTFDAESLDRRWVSVSSGDAPYAKLVKSLSIAAQLAEFTPVEPGLANHGTVEVQGHTAYAVTGTPIKTTSGGAPGSATLYVGVDPPHLPLGGSVALTRGSRHETRLVSFSRWGEPVTITAPTGSVPLSSIP